jgi:hypothetical protein
VDLGDDRIRRDIVSVEVEKDFRLRISMYFEMNLPKQACCHAADIISSSD